MEQDATQLIAQRLAELPEDVRNAVQAADLGDRVRAIGARHTLHIDQTGELEDETLLAMLGFSPMEELGARLSTALHLPREEGERLAADVANEVFGPIRESMKKFVADRAERAAEASAPPPSTPPAVSAKPPLSPDLHKADVMLTEKTVSLPAAKPIYKADPYREPI